MYHRFSPDGQAGERFLCASEFAAQLDFIMEHHRTWNPDQELDFVEGKLPAPDRPPVVITVDDGYLDFFEVAFPLLCERSMTATLFVTTDFVDRRAWFWWDRVSYILAHAPPGRREFSVGRRRLQADPGDPQQRADLWSAIVPPLRFVTDEEKEATVARLASDCGVDIPPAPPREYAAASWEQVHEMANAGIVVGAHTRTHPILSRIDADRADEEVSGARRELAAHGLPGTAWFAYPQGGPADYLPETVQVVRRAGFRGAYLAYQDPALPRDAFHMPRYCISNDRQHFRWVLCGAEHLFFRLRVLLGKKTGVGKRYWQGYGET